jgi:hypothetical protein
MLVIRAMRACLFFAAVGLWAGQAVAAVVPLAPVRLQADADSEVEVRVLADRSTVGIWSQGVAPQTLRAALVAYAGAKAEVDLVGAQMPRSPRVGMGESLAYLKFGVRLRGVAADWAAGAWTLTFEPEDLRTTLSPRLIADRLPLPTGVDTDQLMDAERKLTRQDTGGAKAAYEALTEVYALSAWATLRLGDVAVIQDDAEAACLLWLSVDAANPGRVAGTLANLRARAFNCPQAPAPDYAGLMRKRPRDDRVGQKLREEARWALTFEADPSALEAALAAGEPALTTPVLRTLWARLLRSAKPWDVGRLADRADAALTDHPEGLDLALGIARNWCALDLAPAAAARVARMPRKNWLVLSPAALRTWTEAVAACALGDKPEQEAADARALAELPSPVTQLRASIERTQDRLEAVEQVLVRETAIAEDTP